MTLDEARVIVSQLNCNCGVPRVRSRQNSRVLCCVNIICKLIPWPSRAKEREAIKVIAKAEVEALPIATRTRGKRFAVQHEAGAWVHVDGRSPAHPDAKCATDVIVARVMRSDGGMLVRKFRRLAEKPKAEARKRKEADGRTVDH